MSDDKVKVGVVGVGSLGQHHARVYAELDNAELVGIFDVDHARASELAEKHGTKAAASLSELASIVDAVSVVVPTDLHAEVASELMAEQVHLLVEKPIASTTREAENMVRQAQTSNVILQVGHIERFNPVLDFLESLGQRPRFIEAHRLAPYPPPREGLVPRGTEVGVILDLMIHDLEVILHLVGSPVKEFHAVGVPVLSITEDIANVRLGFENGCVANITASRISPERMRKIRVFHEDAYISLDYMRQEGEYYRKTATGIEQQAVPIEKEEALVKELRAFVDCVAGHGKPVVTGEHAAEALKLAAAITNHIRETAS